MSIRLLHRKLNEKLELNIPLRWAALVLFLLTLGPRLLYINKGFFHHDAILMIDAVRASFEQGTLVPLLDGRYAYVAFNLPFYLLFDTLGLPVDLSMNVLTAVIASISVVLLYLIVREVTGGGFCAIAAALLFAFMPVHFSGSTHTMIHPFSVCLVLLAFCLTIMGNKTNSTALYGWSSIALALAISARFPNVLLIPSLAIVYFNPKLDGLRVRIDRGNFSRNLLFLAGPLAVGLALIYYVQKGAIVEMSGRVMFLGLFSPILKLGAANIMNNIGLVGCVLLAAGIGLCLAQERRRPYGLAFLIWLVVMLFFYGNMRTYSDRFYSIIFPVLALFMAMGLELLGRFSRVAALCLLLYLVTTMFIFVRPFVEERHAYSGQKEYALWVASQTEPDAIVLAMDDGVFIRYYGHRRVMDHPQGSVELAEEWAAEIKEHLRKGTRVYLISSAFTYDPGKIIEETIFKHFLLINMGSHTTEAYHNACVRRRVYEQGMFRLVEKRG